MVTGQSFAVMIQILHKINCNCDFSSTSWYVGHSLLQKFADIHTFVLFKWYTILRVVMTWLMVTAPGICTLSVININHIKAHTMYMYLRFFQHPLIDLKENGTSRQ